MASTTSSTGMQALGSAITGHEDVLDEPGPALGAQALAGARRDEHAEAPLLVEQAVVDELLERLGDGGRVDAVERGVLVRRHHLLVVVEGPLDDVLAQLPGDLPVDRGPIIEHVIGISTGSLHD